MTRRPLASRGGGAARQLDDAIDAILDQRPGPLSAADGGTLELLPVARLLHEALPRFHPRFGFEERLAARLRGAGADVVALPISAPGALESTLRGTLRRRGLVAGGAIASGLSLALPLAGAALMAWRRSRPTGDV